MNPEQLPSVRRGENPPEEVAIMMLVFDGLRLVFFRDDDTLTRTFDEPWDYMNYIYQQPEGRDRPLAYFGYPHLALHLAELGFTDYHSPEPLAVDKEMFAEYTEAFLERELPTTTEGGDEH